MSEHESEDDDDDLLLEPSHKISIGVGELESYLGDTILRISEMHKRQVKHEEILQHVPGMKLMIEGMVSAQTLMAQSASRMADVFEKSEARQGKLENRNDSLADKAAGKDQIPLRSHYWTLATALAPTLVMALGAVLYALFITKQDLKASLKGLEIGQQQIEQKVAESVHDIKTTAAETASDMKEALAEKEAHDKRK